VKKDFGVVIDWETSGIQDPHSPWRTYLEGPQGIAIGAITVELPSFEPLAEFTSQVRFLGVAHGISYGGPLYESLTWDPDAERIHALSPGELINAPMPTEVADKFVRFVKNSVGIEEARKIPIMICGHNVGGDSYYLRQLLYLGGAERKLRFHSRMLDSFTMGYLLYGTRSSNELFHLTSGAVRGTHHALEDARLTLTAFRVGYDKCKKGLSEMSSIIAQ
jgi:hypothetical protein